MMFAAPPEQALEWSDEGVAGANRFLKRVYSSVQSHVARGPVAGRIESGTKSLSDAARGLRRKTHKTIAKVGDDIGRRYTFNTAIAASMELLNAARQHAGDESPDRAVLQEALEAVVLLLAPIVPHVCHELWHQLGHADAVVNAPWPRADEEALTEDAIEIVLQVNGKLRGRLSVQPDAPEDAIVTLALADANVQRFIDGKTIRRSIYVPGKLVNVVV